MSPSKFLLSFFALVSAFHGNAQTNSPPSSPGPQIPVFDNIVEEKAPFPGYLYRPKEAGPHPAIIVLHGSEGGNGNFWSPPGVQMPTGENSVTTWTARYFASQGFVTYALCYFDCKKQPGFKDYPPDELVNVDIQKITYQAMVWLKKSPFVAGKKLAIWGGSRGAEQALVLASRLGELADLGQKDLVQPDFVLAESPSDYAGPALTKAQATGQSILPVLKSAWLFGGVPVIPFTPIAVEKIKGKILVTFGDHDQVWPKNVNMMKSLARLQKANVPVNFFTYQKDGDPKAAFDQLASLNKPVVKDNFILLQGEGHMTMPGTPAMSFVDGVERAYFMELNK